VHLLACQEHHLVQEQVAAVEALAVQEFEQQLGKVHVEAHLHHQQQQCFI
jgi:hypothetical protein